MKRQRPLRFLDSVRQSRFSHCGSSVTWHVQAVRRYGCPLDTRGSDDSDRLVLIKIPRILPLSQECGSSVYSQRRRATSGGTVNSDPWALKLTSLTSLAEWSNYCQTHCCCGNQDRNHKRWRIMQPYETQERDCKVTGVTGSSYNILVNLESGLLLSVYFLYMCYYIYDN